MDQRQNSTWVDVWMAVDSLLTLSLWVAVLLLPIASVAWIGFWPAFGVAILATILWFSVTKVGTCQTCGLGGVMLHLGQFLSIVAWFLCSIVIGIYQLLS